MPPLRRFASTIESYRCRASSFVLVAVSRSSAAALTFFFLLSNSSGVPPCRFRSWTVPLPSPTASILPSGENSRVVTFLTPMSLKLAISLPSSNAATTTPSLPFATVAASEPSRDRAQIQPSSPWR